ncbi:MAG: hypothetical protein IPK52_23085 [Chloroflexi bacterium]|nr:hypothetical protein [Chloroflexota bacterium]
MSSSKRRIIVLWEPLIMLTIGALLLIIVHPVAPVARLFVNVVAGLLFTSAGVTFVVWLRGYLGP